ncbi:unnamed protein product [Allacma fusca]|uniref:Uncharacterized protein n=1 Tax=Allacma fusca TaxID=39272 RepID=A0A8J2L9I6_9HEXA|nr:unnamed protein product [Allacma fusca]
MGPCVKRKFEEVCPEPSSVEEHCEGICNPPIPTDQDSDFEYSETSSMKSDYSANTSTVVHFTCSNCSDFSEVQEAQEDFEDQLRGWALNDAKRHGPLDKFSSFPFESYLRKMKRMLRANHHPLQQLHGRLQERSIINNCNREETPVRKFQHKMGPVLDMNTRFEQYQLLELGNLQFSTKKECYFGHQSSIYKLANIIRESDKIYFLGQIIEEKLIINLTPAEHMYALVKFVTETKPDGTTPCDIIPMIWLTQDQSSCFWPGNHHYATAFKNLTKPSNKWKICPIKLNLYQMTKSFKSCLDRSTNSTSHKNPLQRRSKVVVSRRESSDSDSGQNIVVSNGLPEAPDVPFDIPECNTDESPRGSVFLDVNIPLLMVDEVEPITDGNNEQTGFQIKKPKSLERQILYKIEELNRKVDEVSRDIKCLKMAGVASIPTPKGCPKLPMNFVSTVGGVSIKEATERVLSKILTNEVAAGFNWCGIVKTTVKPKKPLKDFDGILILLFGSVRKIISTAYDKDVETCAKYWLRHEKGRCIRKSSNPNSEADLSEG